MREHTSTVLAVSDIPQIVDQSEIRSLLRAAREPDAGAVREAIAKARGLGGLSLAETALLLQTESPGLIAEMLDAAREVKDAIYGRRLVLFAPLYYTSHCTNSCLYCGFRRENRRPRRRLDAAEVAEQTRALLRRGHKRLLVIGGDDASRSRLDYLLEVIQTVYATRSDDGHSSNIRRVNVETAPMSVDEFRQLKGAHIGTYVCFQETYDRETYQVVHPRGPKADYQWRLQCMDRAMQAGIDDVGIGVLFGLHNYREEVLGLLLHAQHLEATYGAGPHTISVPRLEPAEGAPLSQIPPSPVSDDDFKKLVAVLRLAVPYTGIILSTREPAALRGQLLDLGVSQMSAGSSTEPGGYLAEGAGATAQFAVGDHRSLDQVIADIAQHGYIPSFCTGCYRKGRTGPDFMELAKPGLIRHHCLPNALLSFREYLLDYGSPTTRELGERLIRDELHGEVPAEKRAAVEKALARVAVGERDVYF